MVSLFQFTDRKLMVSAESASETFEVIDSIGDVPAQDWNVMTGQYVFADHRFLKILEDSGSVGERTGWYPQYLLMRENGRLTGAVPFFLKTNSYGEYIFDWSWAHAAEMSALPYYPKLVAAIPFTPATGPRFFTLPSGAGAEAREKLLAMSDELARRTGSQSVHFLFIQESDVEILRSQGHLIRHSFQYHWKNEGWKDFGSFLGALRSKRRKEILRERASARASGLKIRRLSGDQLTPEHGRIMSRLYRSTIEKMGAHAYLTPRFFELIFERMKNEILFVTAETEAGQTVAGALNFMSGSLDGGTKLFGRYWGCLEEYRHLHFEICYYQAIDWALDHGVEVFEAGAQGEHKFNRGFRPRICLSSHRMVHPGLHRAVESFIEDEKTAIAQILEGYQARDPFNRSQGK
jgi:uncharacterized protein